MGGGVAGIVVGTQKCGMKFAGANVNADAMQLSTAFGNASMKYSPIGLQGDGTTIKLG